MWEFSLQLAIGRGQNFLVSKGCFSRARLELWPTMAQFTWKSLTLGKGAEHTLPFQVVTGIHSAPAPVANLSRDWEISLVNRALRE